MMIVGASTNICRFAFPGKGSSSANLWCPSLSDADATAAAIGLQPNSFNFPSKTCALNKIRLSTVLPSRSPARLSKVHRENKDIPALKYTRPRNGRDAGRRLPSFNWGRLAQACKNRIYLVWFVLAGYINDATSKWVTDLCSRCLCFLLTCSMTYRFDFSEWVWIVHEFGCFSLPDHCETQPLS